MKEYLYHIIVPKVFGGQLKDVIVKVVIKKELAIVLELGKEILTNAAIKNVNVIIVKRILVVRSNMKAVTPLTNNSNIRLGYEVECYVRDRHAHDFERAVKQINDGNIISDDGSIEPPDYEDDTEFYTYEIPTAVLPPKQAIENLKAIFALLQEWGGTNESCGFHLNISSADKNRMKRFNPIPFISSPLWNRLLKDFNRDECDYCMPVWDDTMSPMAQFERLIDEIGEDHDYGYNEGELGCLYGKDSVVNLSNWNRGTRVDSRVEIRGMGGAKYHYRLPLITNYTRRIMKLFMLCCDIPMIPRTRFAV